jgi:hypothetical protein
MFCWVRILNCTVQYPKRCTNSLIYFASWRYMFRDYIQPFIKRLRVQWRLSPKMSTVYGPGLSGTGWTIHSQHLHKRFIPYRAVNTLRLGYKNQSLNAVYGNIWYLFWDPFKTQECNVWAERRIFLFLNLVVYKVTIWLWMRSEWQIGEVVGGSRRENLVQDPLIWRRDWVESLCSLLLRQL